MQNIVDKFLRLFCINSKYVKKFSSRNFSEDLFKIIVESRIPGYPGPSKERGMKARLMRGKIFRGKIRIYLQLHVVHSYDF